MTALPRITDPDRWRQRAEAKERNRQNSQFERKMMILAVCKQIRSELREEKRKRQA